MSFAPVYDDRSRALILGTWPSPKSREMAFYYGHPQNRFWPMLAALTGEPVPAREDKTLKRKSRSSCATGWRSGIRWKAAPSPALRMLPSRTWCPTTSRPCWQKPPSKRCSATGPRHTASIQSICSRCPASLPLNCPAPAPPTRPAARKSCGKSGPKRWGRGFPNDCEAVNYP